MYVWPKSFNIFVIYTLTSSVLLKLSYWANSLAIEKCLKPSLNWKIYYQVNYEAEELKKMIVREYLSHKGNDSC